MSSAAAVRERPIIFGAESVRAILDGRKRQTRRVVRPQPELQWFGGDDPGHLWVYDPGPKCRNLYPVRHPEVLGFCPHGKHGDRLWVRERAVRFTGIAFEGQPWSHIPWALAPDGDPHRALLPEAGNERHVRELDASAACVPVSPLFMPRWASRLTLEITGVRVERIQSISEIDCENEMGAEPYSLGSDAYARFRDGWDALNKKRGFGWDADPWVWVLTFRRID